MADDRDWIACEPGLRTALYELARFRRRAAAHPLLTLLITLSLVAAGVFRRASQHPVYTTRVVFRVTEGDFDLATAPHLNNQLAAFVNEEAFTSQRLLQIVRAHGLYQSALARGAAEAVESFRDDLEIEVWRNYFLEERETEDPARSARLAISFHSGSARTAYEVAQELARLVVETSQAGRIEQAEAAAARAELAGEAARRSLYEARAALAESVQLAHKRPSEQLALEIADLKAAAEAAEMRVSKHEARTTDLGLRVEIERRDLDVQFQLADGGRQAATIRQGPRQLAPFAIFLTAVLLPLVAITLGTFDPRVYDTDDIGRLGLAVLGHVGHFPGDQRAQFDDRRARDSLNRRDS